MKSKSNFQKRIELKLLAYRHKLRKNQLSLSIKQISMLHIEAIEKLQQYARRAKGNCLEVGSYIGGSTVAISRATTHSVFTFEKGGQYLSHASLPSADILRDLEGNLLRFKCSNVQVIPYDVNSEDGLNKLKMMVKVKSIAFLFIDSDGHVQETINHLSKYLKDDALIAIDDYLVNTMDVKSNQTNREIEALKRNGVLLEDEVVGWGTWFGQLDLTQVITDTAQV